MSESKENAVAQDAANQELAEFSRARLRRLVYAILIVVVAGVGLGKIASVDSAPDRAIQNYRLQQIPKTLQEKSKELDKKNLSDSEKKKELERIGAALIRDAHKERPTLSANDRSRWATIRALVEKDARVYRYTPVLSKDEEQERVDEIRTATGDPNASFKYLPEEILRNCKDECPEKYRTANKRAKNYRRTLVPYAVDKVFEDPSWDSIDVVKHGLPDELYDPANPSSGYLYSSKPTLLPTVMAAPYWVLNRCFGLSLGKRPFETTRILLVIYNLIPLLVALACLASTIELVGRTDLGKIYAFVAAVFASFALAFVATLNNHVPGFVCVSIALWAGARILAKRSDSPVDYLCAGFFGAFAVACELPALAFAALLCAVLLVKRPRKTILCAVPAGLVVAAAFCVTNNIAHGSMIPAYAHKRDHMALAQEYQNAIDNGETIDPATLFDPNDWYFYNYYPAGRPRQAKYARLSHWANRTGIDRGEPSIKRYAFHSTIGLRGVFSLSPTWALALLGALLALFRAKSLAPEDPEFALIHGESAPVLENAKASTLRILAAFCAILTVVFFAFFLTRDQGDRNYGGMSCCLRWFFPLIPLYILQLVPCVDKFGRSKIFRVIAGLALLWATLSAFYPTWSPWIHPWLYQIAVDQNWTVPY